ncbi:prevent-host-death family protein [Candidatus Magnetoovum chiemensis]|nr:prevent-host-death family protein [Candidatus Magnetoovum chiemensis]
MVIDSNNSISVTQLERQLSQKLKEISETGEPLYVLKDNEMTAVLASSEEYKRLKDLEDIIEHLEIADIIETRMMDHDSSKNMSWETMKKRYGLQG